MYSQTLYPKTKQVLKEIKKLPILSGFYLAGGTGLALQLGHRKSADLDFFTAHFPKRDILLQSLEQYSPKLIQEAPGTLDLLVKDVVLTFLEYKYPLIEDFVDFEGVRVASVIDIACMKLSAISSRGSKKDYVDLYKILQKESLNNIFAAFEDKFTGVDYQKTHLLKSLLYFADAEDDPDPDYLEEIRWSDVKKSLENDVRNYLKTL